MHTDTCSCFDLFDSHAFSVGCSSCFISSNHITLIMFLLPFALLCLSESGPPLVYLRQKGWHFFSSFFCFSISLLLSFPLYRADTSEALYIDLHSESIVLVEDLREVHIFVFYFFLHFNRVSVLISTSLTHAHCSLVVYLVFYYWITSGWSRLW